MKSISANARQLMEEGIAECWLCGEVTEVERCRCSDCREANGKNGRLLCAECANGIFQ